MDYKVLGEVFVPERQEKFEFYVPINKYVEFVITILNQAIKDLEYGDFPIRDNFRLCNRRTGEVYDNGAYIRNTTIKNGTQLVLF